jgi:hypothetical protein
MQGFWKSPSEPAKHQAEGEANVKFFATDLCLNSGGTHVERIGPEHGLHGDVRHHREWSVHEHRWWSELAPELDGHLPIDAGEHRHTGPGVRRQSRRHGLLTDDLGPQTAMKISGRARAGHSVRRPCFALWNTVMSVPSSGIMTAASHIKPDSEAGSIHLEVVTDDDLSFPTLADLVQILLVGKAGLCSGAVIQNQKSGLGLPRNLGQL